MPLENGFPQSDKGKKLSPELRFTMAVAKVMFIPAMAIAGVGTLLCITIAVLGELNCARNAVLLDGTSDYLIFLVWWMFGVLLVRAVGKPPSEKAFETLRSTIDLYNIPLFRCVP